MLSAEIFDFREIEQEIEILTPHKMQFLPSPSVMITDSRSEKKLKNPLNAYKTPIGIRIK